MFAWRDGQYVFLEEKRRSPRYKDEVDDYQEAWVRTALSMPGDEVSWESFGFVQWDYVA